MRSRPKQPTNPHFRHNSQNYIETLVRNVVWQSCAQVMERMLLPVLKPIALIFLGWTL